MTKYNIYKVPIKSLWSGVNTLVRILFRLLLGYKDNTGLIKRAFFSCTRKPRHLIQANMIIP